MKARTGLPVLLTFAGLALAGCGGTVESSDGPVAAGPLDQVTGTLTVRADSSLKDVVDAVAAGVERAHPKVHVAVEVSSTATTGGRPDVVVSVSRQGIERAHTSGQVDSPTVVAQQPLALAVAPGNPGHVNTLADLERAGVSVGLCRSDVTCGEAASSLLSAAHVAPADPRREADAEAGLTAVTRGQVDAALVWASDLRGDSGRASSRAGVREVAMAPGQQQNIRLIGLGSRPVLAATASTGNRPAGEAFLDELRGPHGQQLLRSDGFR